MSALIVLPPNPITRAYYDRAVRALSFVGIGIETVVFSAPRSQIEHYRELLREKTLMPYDEKAIRNYEILVFVEGPTGDRVVFEPGRRAKQRVYSVDRMGTIELRSDGADEEHYPHIGAHVFNRLGPRANNQYYYFPYGYLFRRTNEGPINSFGHRIPFELSQFESRDLHHKIIAVFGGSAAWGMYNHPEETFFYLLEQKLNAHCSREGLTTRVTVLNFSLCGNVVLNEIQSYILFCNKIRPEIVLAHDGANDFSYGQQSDTHLLDCHGITYQFNLEAWSHILHKTDHIPLCWPDARGFVPTINYPRRIIAAYFERQQQFQTLVKAFGGVFIAGLQPTIFSKLLWSPMEKIWLKSFSPKEEPFKNLKYLYEKYLRLKPESSLTHFVNHHERFKVFGEKHTFFGDTVHMTPDGNAAVADIYFDYIAKNILPGMK